MLLLVIVVVINGNNITVMKDEWNKLRKEIEDNMAGIWEDQASKLVNSPLIGEFFVFHVFRG